MEMVQEGDKGSYKTLSVKISFSERKASCFSKINFEIRGLTNLDNFQMSPCIPFPWLPNTVQGN